MHIRIATSEPISEDLQLKIKDEYTQLRKNNSNYPIFGQEYSNGYFHPYSEFKCDILYLTYKFPNITFYIYFIDCYDVLQMLEANDKSIKNIGLFGGEYNIEGGMVTITMKSNMIQMKNELNVLYDIE